MRTIKTKIIVSVILCALLSAVVCGGISVANSSSTSYESSRTDMLLHCENQSMTLISMMEKIEQSVSTVYSVALERLDNVSSFKNSKSYVDEYTKEMEDILLIPYSIKKKISKKLIRQKTTKKESVEF